MANFEVSENPVYVDANEVRKLETTDRAHASLFNTIFQIFLGNFAFLKRKIEKKVIVGSADTKLEKGSTLFVIDDWKEPEQPKKFEGAAYDNIIFSVTQPSAGRNWAQISGAADAGGTRVGTGKVENINIIEGKLVVSEEPDSDATFFAHIEK